MLDTYSVKNRHLLLKRFYWKLRERRVLARSQGLHCLNISEITKAMNWIENYPKFVCGNGISARQFDEMPARGQFRAAHPEIGDRPLVLFMSRIHPKKGLDRLLPVWKTVIDRFPDSRFAIAGAGDTEYTALIDKLIKDHNLSGHVIRVGQLAGAAKWQAIVDADLFVLPSHQEGFSMAITESLAAGVPAVATTECNFTQLTTDDCGVEVANSDMNAFARITADLLADPACRKRLGDNGRKLVRSRFTWEGIVADLQHVYEWILAGRPLPPDGADVWRPAVALQQINGTPINIDAPVAIGH
jgi:glycosyltransferase involved in cell wall biosynthesis